MCTGGNQSTFSCLSHPLPQKSINASSGEGILQKKQGVFENKGRFPGRGVLGHGASIWGSECPPARSRLPQSDHDRHRSDVQGSVPAPSRDGQMYICVSCHLLNHREFVTRTFFQKRFSQKPWRSKGSAALPLHARSGLPRRLLSVRSFPRLVVSSPGVGPSGALGLQGSTVTFARFSSHWVVRLLVSPSPPEAYLLVSNQHVSDLLQMVLFHPAGW